MEIIQNLNKLYVENKEVAQILKTCEQQMKTVRANSVDDNQYFNGSLECMKKLVSNGKMAKLDFLQEVIMVGLALEKCKKAIEENKNAFLNANNSRLIDTANNVKRMRSVYEEKKNLFFEKYKLPVTTQDEIIDAFRQCLDYEISVAEKHMKNHMAKAEEIVMREYTTELKDASKVVSADALPEDMLVARYEVDSNPYELLRDIGIRNTYRNILSDLKESGNILVQTDYRHMTDQKIDEFVIAYIMRYIEIFPLGSVNIHIFDQNTNYLYKRLYNNFQTENSGEVAKKVVQIHTAMNDITTFRDVVCEDIFKKTSVNCPDLYSIYEHDTVDTFNLIVLRDGLVDDNGYASAEFLSTVNSLTKCGDIGHKCGIRFLIIDNSSSYTKKLNDNMKFLISSIHKNCQFSFNYYDDKFWLGDKNVEMLRVVDNLDIFVQERAVNVAKAINQKEKTYVSLDEIAVAANVEEVGSVVSIPVGKAGGNSVELPLSCKDEDGTLAGQCIGYMVIGQSGSGKSSFFHSLVLNGCVKYSPKELQFWLLDFKYGGASSKYNNSGLPHIRIVAEDNKIDDAVCLLQMISEEMERRNKLFNKQFVQDIVEYNCIARSDRTMEYLPRIVIVIDEIQEIFREDNAMEIKELISKNIKRMRSAGMHFIMIAQNLSEGKSYMLKEAFLPTATGRVCFRVAQDIPRDSGFEEEFVQRKQEISELKTGEAYIGYGKGTCKKVKIAYVSPEEMSGKYFSEIRDKYLEYSMMKPLVIGSKKRLQINSVLQHSQGTYFDALNKVEAINGINKAIIGEDAYRMSPLQMVFSQYENSATLLLGNDKLISSSLCTSIAMSLLKQNVKIDVFNGDRTKIQVDFSSVVHPFMYVCQSVSKGNRMIQNHRLDQFEDVVKELYSQYLERRASVQKSEDEEPVFEPRFLIVNDLFGIESFQNNVVVESDSNDTLDLAKMADTDRYNVFGNRTVFSTAKKEGEFKENIQTILATLVKNGYRYNLHVILALKGDPSTWRNSRIASEVNNIIMFNTTQYAEQIENSYYLKQMLKGISNEGNEETMAVWISKRSFSKIRPIIYDMSNLKEVELVELLAGEV